MTKSTPQRLMSLALGAAVALASTPAVAAHGIGPAKGKKGKAADAAPATDGRTVALLRFSGTKGGDLRSSIQTELQDKKFSVKSVALEVVDAASKVKCKGPPDGPDCLAAIGKWLNANPKTAADFIVYGGASADPVAVADIGVYDIAKGEMVKDYDLRLAENDLILPIAVPNAVVTDLQHHIEPPPPPTEQEQKILAELDEPEKTPEELAAERKALADAEAAAEAASQDAVIDTSEIEVDLKKDFKDFCREGPRKKRKSRDDPKDLRPKCSLGPFWGYWQPRAWVALTLTAGTAVATGVFYGLALGARGPYKDAVDALEAYEDTVPGDPKKDPNSICNAEGVCYDALATEVSETGATMRRRAIIGDVLLGTTVLLGGVLAIIIFQDRSDAKQYIKQEKGLRAISNLRFGPMITKQTQGASFGFSF